MEPVLDAEQAAWITQGAVSILVASRGESLRPSLGQALGCRTTEAGRRITIFVLEEASRALVEDVRAGRPVSVVFTHSASTRSLQVKARDAREASLGEGDEERMKAYVGALARQWAAQGQPEEFTRALLARAGGTILAFELVPHVAFDQTPGPRAGTPLVGGA